MSTEYGIDPYQLRTLVIRPTLKRIALWSQAAENIVLGTALQESRASYLRQLGKGPALGIYQMEPATYADIYANFLKYRLDLQARVNMLAIGEPDANEMVGNLYYATAMCRVFYLRISAPLPAADDAEALAAYYKKYYNTHLGAATVAGAIPHFREALA